MLARDTVAPAAMHKHDMQALQAMGVPDFDEAFLGHQHVRNVKYDDGKALKPLSSVPLSQADKSSLVNTVSLAVNSRYKDMRAAFRYMDLDNSGYLSANEIQRAVQLWNIPIDAERLQAIGTLSNSA